MQNPKTRLFWSFGWQGSTNSTVPICWPVAVLAHPLNPRLPIQLVTTFLSFVSWFLRHCKALTELAGVILPCWLAKEVLLLSYFYITIRGTKRNPWGILWRINHTWCTSNAGLTNADFAKSLRHSLKGTVWYRYQPLKGAFCSRWPSVNEFNQEPLLMGSWLNPKFPTHGVHATNPCLPCLGLFIPSLIWQVLRYLWLKTRYGVRNEGKLWKCKRFSTEKCLSFYMWSSASFRHIVPLRSC